MKQAEAALGAAEEEVDAEKKALAEELAADEKRPPRSAGGADGARRALEPRSMALFEQVAKVRKGVAICMATRDGLCSVCHVRLRPQVFQQVRQNDAIIQCDSCQRILLLRAAAAAGGTVPPLTPA